jgi:hypothetical protein
MSIAGLNLRGNGSIEWFVSSLWKSRDEYSGLTSRIQAIRLCEAGEFGGSDCAWPDLLAWWEKSMEKRGKKWCEVYDLKRTSLGDHGFSLMGIKEWRTRELEAGRPSGLDDFFVQHNLCLKCRCSGVVMVGRDEAGTPLWEICEDCGGTGTPRSSMQNDGPEPPSN